MKKINISILSIIALASTAYGCSAKANKDVSFKNEQNNQITMNQEITNDNDTTKNSPNTCEHERVIHYDRVNPSLNKSGHIEFFYCVDCHKSFYDADLQNEVPNSNLGLDNIQDGRYISPVTGTFSLLNQNIKDYLDAKEDRDIITALRANTPFNDQRERTIIWHDNNNGPYTVEVAKDRMFTSFKSYEADGIKFTFDSTFIPGETYFYRVKDHSNNYIMNDLSFRIDDSYSLRTMYVEGVSNVRDIGGWTAKNGKKVQYGKIYRGGNFNNITAKGKETLMDAMGVKNEIDLRTNGTQKVVDSRMTYNKCGMWQYTMIIPDFQMWNDDYSGSVRGMEEKLGENTIYFLPYLSGERSPHNDVNARGAFVGLAINSTRQEMSLAVLEGVSFALRDCVEIARKEGVVIPKSTLCGGGAKSSLWQKILANVLNMDICLLETEQGPSYGGAMLAMVANKEYATIEDAVNALVKVRKVIKPDPEIVAKYEKKYQTFKQISPNLKDIYKIL